MLKVSLHFATPSRVNPNNALGRLDIGYGKLDALADYKAVLSMREKGELAPVQLSNYPRWSASIWDLVTRLVCLSLAEKEALPDVDEPNPRRGAFIDELTAVIEHWPDGVDTRRATIGVAHVSMLDRRCNYRAVFEDDLAGRIESDVFRHTPKRLSQWGLLARAYAWTKTGDFVLPPRPTLYTPLPVAYEGKSYVPLETVAEPTRTGIQRWLVRKGFGTTAMDWVEGPCVTEARFVEFLRSAV